LRDGAVAKSKMDILTEVLDALQVKATEVRRLSGLEEHSEEIERGRAVMFIIGAGHFLAAAGTQQYDLVANDYLLLVGRQAIVLTPKSPPTGGAIRCAYSVLADVPHPLARQLPVSVHSAGRRLIDRAELGGRFQLLDGELANTPPGMEFVVSRLAEVVLVDVLRSSHDETDAQPSFLAALADGPVRASLDAIHSDPQRAWRVEDLAAVSGLSRATYAERFHSVVGEPPLRYLRSWRLVNARRELARSGAPIATVAARAGYRSANGFSRAFRRFFGETPKAVRGRGR
jgi:AraC-like DNA-binding protein